MGSHRHVIAAPLVPIDTTAPDFASAPISDTEAAAMFRACLNLFLLWEVSDLQAAIPLDLPIRYYARLNTGTGGRIDRDQRARLSNLMGIHKALRTIFREPVRSYARTKPTNAAFGGRFAPDVMLGGEFSDLMRVRRHIVAERCAR